MTTINLTCFRCGICCARYDVPVRLDEAARLAEFIKVNIKTWLAEYCNPAWPGVRYILLKRVDGRCPFLSNQSEDGTRSCQVHAVRPRACRDWQAGVDKTDCLHGLQELFRLSIDNLGQLIGSQSDIDQFEEALDDFSK